MKTLIIILVSFFIAFMLYQIKESICPTNRTTYWWEQLFCSQYQKLIRDIEEQKKINEKYLNF